MTTQTTTERKGHETTVEYNADTHTATVTSSGIDVGNNADEFDMMDELDAIGVNYMAEMDGFERVDSNTITVELEAGTGMSISDINGKTTIVDAN